MPQANNHTITPALPRALPSSARRKVEAAVEAHLAAVAALTAFLDEADGDPDLEGDNADDEPSLGWGLNGERGIGGDDREADYIGYYPGGIAHGFTADMEPDIDADHEPRLPPFVLDQAKGGPL
jgi:hypothetical protein